MTDVDIILKPYEYINSNKFTYNTNGQTVEIIRTIKFHGYICHNHRPSKVGKYTLKSVRTHSSNSSLDFDKHFPVKDVSGFFVFYEQTEREPLLICIQTMDSKQYITYRYFCPRGKDRKSWMGVPDLVLDPKISASQEEISNRLDEQTTLMEGVIIDIEKTTKYKNENVNINPSHCVMNGYEVYTHEVASLEPFHIKQIKFKGELFDINCLKNCQVIAVHAISGKHSVTFEPISVCVVKYVKNYSNSYQWYFREDFNSNKWTPDKKFHGHLEYNLIERYINKLYDNLFELDIIIDKGFCYYNETQPFTNKGIKGTISYSGINSKYKKYIYSLDVERNFKIKSLTINDKTQTICAKKAYSKFYIVCDDKRDKDYPLFMCFPDSNKSYQWYRRIHYGSNNWIECDELKKHDPQNEIADNNYESAYSKLFWIDVDIDHDKIKNLKDYVKNNRNIGNKTIINGKYEGIEIVNYNSYPLYVRILQNGKPIEMINETEDMDSVCVFYDIHKRPVFIVFERAEHFHKYIWYSKDDYSDKWEIYTKLDGKDPKKNDYNLSDHKTEIYVQMEEEEKTNTITAQALGTTVGTAACCGLGYFIYTNVSSFSGMISSIFS